MRIGVYPGTFDPITYGHIDIIKRASNLFDQLYIVIPVNLKKTTLFSVKQRINMVKESLNECQIACQNIIITSTPKLTTAFASDVKACAIIRGLRMMSDFEYELQMFAVNKSLNEEVETIFIMSSHEFSFLSSSIVKEVASFGGEIDRFVPSCVKKMLTVKFAESLTQ